MDDGAQELFLREIEVTRALRHPNIVALLDFGRHEGRMYFALEYCAGGSAEALRGATAGGCPCRPRCASRSTRSRASPPRTRPGFVHRDLKPDNVLLAEDGTARLADFGLAKSFQQAGLSGMTATGAVAGTFQFMPREQLTSYRQVRPMSDVWSLAATLYFLLTGEYARDFDSHPDPLAVILRGGTVPLRQRDPSVPGTSPRVIDTRARRRPVARFPDARAFATRCGGCSGDARPAFLRVALPVLRRHVRPGARGARGPHGPLPALRVALRRAVAAAGHAGAPTPAPTRPDADVAAPTVAEAGRRAAPGGAGAPAPTVAEAGPGPHAAAPAVPRRAGRRAGSRATLVLGLYEVAGVLGEGGMGRVYRVRHRGWGLDLAVKAPLPAVLEAAGGADLFEREAETWVNLGLHPHVVTCHYVRRVDGRAARVRRVRGRRQPARRDPRRPPRLGRGDPRRRRSSSRGACTTPTSRASSTAT